VAEELKANAKFRHVFAVIRLDEFHAASTEVEHRFAVTKVMLTEEAAEEEIARLNALNEDKGCRYVVHVTRLDER
jgi:hypothetical protein